MSFLKNIKEPISTIIGAVVILASVASVFILELDWSQASIGIAAGVGIMFMKDGKGNGTGGKLVMLFLALVFVAGSCRSKPTDRIVYVQTTDSTSQKDSLIRDTILIVADTIKSSFKAADIDSAVRVSSKRSGRHYLRSESKGRAKLKVYAESGAVFVEGSCDSLHKVNSTLLRQVRILRNKILTPNTVGATDLKSDSTIEIITQLAYIILALLAGIGIGRITN
jgi:hypothetical protein